MVGEIGGTERAWRETLCDNMEWRSPERHDPDSSNSIALPAPHVPPSPMFKRYWWMFLAMAPVGLLAGFLIASVVTYLIPTEYESFSTIEIKPRIKKATDQHSAPASPNFSGTELKKIKSRNTLMKVVDTLDLDNKWGMNREDVLLALREIVK